MAKKRIEKRPQVNLKFNDKEYDFISKRSKKCNVSTYTYCKEYLLAPLFK